MHNIIHGSQFEVETPKVSLFLKKIKLRRNRKFSKNENYEDHEKIENFRKIFEKI